MNEPARRSVASWRKRGKTETYAVKASADYSAEFRLAP